MYIQQYMKCYLILIYFYPFYYFTQTHTFLLYSLVICMGGNKIPFTLQVACIHTLYDVYINIINLKLYISKIKINNKKNMLYKITLNVYILFMLQSKKKKTKKTEIWKQQNNTSTLSWWEWLFALLSRIY